MAELWFYHLERASAEDALPRLLTKTLERRWRALVRLGGEERLRALDSFLWTFRDDAFLPHGAVYEPHAEHQPILLTTGPANVNEAHVLFLVDDAPFPELEQGGGGFERCVLLFNGADPETLSRAREQWKQAKAAGLELSYWQQTPGGKWEKRG
ncbi:MAG: DNA polymerase III subunit chi [bacterium]